MLISGLLGAVVAPRKAQRFTLGTRSRPSARAFTPKLSVFLLAVRWHRHGRTDSWVGLTACALERGQGDA